MKKLEFFSKGYNSSYKVGEYEFLAKVNYLPLFLITRLVRVRIALTNPKAGTDPWKKSLIVRHSRCSNEIHMLISSYLEDTDYFKLT